MAALGGVEGRDAHQAMDTALAGQLPKGIFSDDGEGGGFDARLFAVLIVVHLGFEALLLGPAQVHAQQHLGPVLALSAAGAGVNGDDGVHRVGLAAEHRAGFEFLGKPFQGFDLLVEFNEDILAFAGQLDISFDVLGAANQRFVIGHHHFQALLIAHERFGCVGIGPERRIGQFGFYFGEFPADAGRVKDTPAGRGLDRGRERKRIRDRSTTWLCSYDLTFLNLRGSYPLAQELSSRPGNNP